MTELLTPTAAETDHDVHVFAVVRVKVPGIMARSHIAAIREALGRVNFYALFDSCAQPKVECVEFAEEFFHYLVDDAGDEEFGRTQWYKNGEDGIVQADKNGR